MSTFPFPLPNDDEAETRRVEVDPQLRKAGWEEVQILREHPITAGQIQVNGRNARRQRPRRADYLLRVGGNFPIAVVEAKRRHKHAADGIQQAKFYAEQLQLKFAYATNGSEILEVDLATGEERFLDRFPSPTELILRLTDYEGWTASTFRELLKPLRPFPEKPLRYYQEIAIHRATRAILEGRDRLLLTLATGTGKTMVAFQVAWKLWENRWNRRGTGFRPKILFLADRDVLVSDPYNKEFEAFGNNRCLLTDGFTTSKDVYFGTYQSLMAESQAAVMEKFRRFPPDFFDLVVVDECHRGSAAEDSAWRQILEYFAPASQLGMTATPLRDDNVDTYAYFSNPLYTYSLKEGIQDGFLAPYVLRRVVTEADAHGWRPSPGQVDKYGRLIPDEEFHTPEFERVLSLLPRSKAVAIYLTEFLKRTDRFAKTIVFCDNQEHADMMRRLLNNLNTDLTRQYPDYVVRVTADDDAYGKMHLGHFCDVQRDTPVLVTTSRLLSTGVDVPTCQNIVIFRTVNSMTEFKQIIGRGTRVREDKQKLFFTIFDFTGSASRRFEDPDFDGFPALPPDDLVIDGDGEVVENPTKPTEPTDADPPAPPTGPGNPPPTAPTRRAKFYVEEGEVSIVAETVQILGDDGRLRTLSFLDYSRERIRKLFATPDDLRGLWQRQPTRQSLLAALDSAGIDVPHLEDLTGLRDADPLDLLLFVAYNLPPRTRRERAEALRRQKPDFFSAHSAQAREILDLLLDKYVEFGVRQLSAEALTAPPISQRATIAEIAQRFGGVEPLRTALVQLQEFLYAA